MISTTSIALGKYILVFLLRWYTILFQRPDISSWDTQHTQDYPYIISKALETGETGCSRGDEDGGGICGGGDGD